MEREPLPSARVAMYDFLRYRVSDAMRRDVITIGPETPLDEVEGLFERHHFNGVPVVDHERRLLGFLTKLDALRAFAFTPQTIVPHYEEILRLPPQRVMTCAPHTVAPEVPRTRVLEELVRTRYKSVPVLEDGRLVGIVSRARTCSRRCTVRLLEGRRADAARSQSGLPSNGHRSARGRP